MTRGRSPVAATAALRAGRSLWISAWSWSAGWIHPSAIDHRSGQWLDGAPDSGEVQVDRVRSTRLP